MKDERIIYFTNDEEAIIDAEMEAMANDPLTYFENAAIEPEETVEIVINYLKKNKMEEPEIDKKVRKIIHSMDTMLIFDSKEEMNKYADLMNTIPYRSKCFREILENYREKLWKNPFFLHDRMEDDRYFATENLKYDGFGPDTYIILGCNMGWRRTSGYKVQYLEDEQDMERALTGNYDYHIELSRPTIKTPYLEAFVATHDSPCGESYILIPKSRLSEALKDPDVKEQYDKFSDGIELDLEETN